MAWTITIGGTGRYAVTEEDAHAALVGFAFGPAELSWQWDPGKTTVPDVAPLSSPPSCPDLARAGGSGDGPTAIVERYRWGYRCYDCVPTDPYWLTVADVALTAAIDSGIGAAALLKAEAVLDAVSDVLARIPVHRTFWQLLPTAGGPGIPQTDPEWSVWRAWAILMGVPDVSLTLTHKILHRKRPWLFPLVDRQTVEVLGPASPGGSWQTIYEEVTANAAAFEHLEIWFGEQASQRGAIPITRLRIHDILVWGSKTGEIVEMIEKGRRVLGMRHG